MYTCHVGVYRRSLAEAIGGFRPEFDGSQDFDFALRMSEHTEHVVHVPRVLYRWRSHAGSTAGSTQAKPSAYPAARRAIAEHLERSSVDADVYFGPWQGIYRVVHRLPQDAVVGAALVAADPTGPEVLDLISKIQDEASSGVSGVSIGIGSTAAEACSVCAGADAVVLFETAALVPLTRGWLARLAAFALQPGVAAVGAKALAPDGRVEHCGLAIEQGLPVPLMVGVGAGDPGPLGVGLLPANVSAVDGVVALSGQALERLGGLEADLGYLALPDFCLRGRQAGWRTTLAPDVLLRRTRPVSLGNDLGSLARFRRRWAAQIPHDLYFELGVVWPGVSIEPAGSG
jgi:hypothetical protein